MELREEVDFDPVPLSDVLWVLELEEEMHMQTSLTNLQTEHRRPMPVDLDKGCKRLAIGCWHVLQKDLCWVSPKKNEKSAESLISCGSTLL